MTATGSDRDSSHATREPARVAVRPSGMPSLRASAPSRSSRSSAARSFATGSLRHPSSLARPPRRLLTLPLTMLAIVALAACNTGASGSSSPSASPGASAGASGAAGPIDTAEQAAAVVLALDPRFAAIKPKDPELIGQSAWYTVDAGPGDAWTVQVRIGWGDCPSGCIDEHIWTYEVARDGSTTLLNETGPSVPPESVPSP
jgi:hypothetical protein